MLFFTTTLWMMYLAEMLLITYTRAESFTVAEDVITTTKAETLENYKISPQRLQSYNNTTNTHLQIEDLVMNNELSSKHKKGKICNNDQSNIHTSDLKALVESHVKNISDKNSTITKIFHDFESETSRFMDEPDTSTGKNAISQGYEYLGNTSDFLIAIKEYNSLVHTYKCSRNSSDGVDFNELPNKEIEDEIKQNNYVIRQFEYLFNLTLLRTDIYYSNEDAFNSMDEYNTKRDLSYLREAITENEETKKLIDEYIPYLEKYYTFIGNGQMYENFINPFTQHIIDKNFWKEQAVNTTKDLEGHKKYLFEETHRVLIQERIQPAAQGIIFIVGFVGNLILLIIFARHQEIRNPPNMMILNLAIGDAVNLIVNIPTFYTYYLSSSWTAGEGLCKTFRFFRQIGIAVSIYSIVMISIQRFLALKQIYRSSASTFKMSTRLKSTIIILLVWIIAALLATPHTINAGVYNGNCYGASTEIHTYYSTFITMFDFVLFCSIPVIIITTLSLSSAYLIKRSVRNMPGESMGMDKHIKNRILSSNVLIGLTIVSAISYIPLYLFMFIYAWSDIQIETPIYIVVFFVIYTLSFANCCFNPIALYIFSGKFRRYFNVYLLCRKLSDEEDSSKQTSSGTNTSTLETKM